MRPLLEAAGAILHETVIVALSWSVKLRSSSHCTVLPLAVVKAQLTALEGDESTGSITLIMLAGLLAVEASKVMRMVKGLAPTAEVRSSCSPAASS